MKFSTLHEQQKQVRLTPLPSLSWLGRFQFLLVKPVPCHSSRIQKKMRSWVSLRCYCGHFLMSGSIQFLCRNNYFNIWLIHFSKFIPKIASLCLKPPTQSSMKRTRRIIVSMCNSNSKQFNDPIRERRQPIWRRLNYLPYALFRSLSTYSFPTFQSFRRSLNVWGKSWSNKNVSLELIFTIIILSELTIWNPEIRLKRKFW